LLIPSETELCGIRIACDPPVDLMSKSHIRAMIEAPHPWDSRMRRSILVIASVVAVVAAVLAAAISPAIYRGQPAASTTSMTASAGGVFTGQCRKADPNATYPLALHIWNPSGEPVKGAWIILYDWDNGIPFEEGYIRDNGTYISRHAYSPSQNMTLMIQNDQTVAGLQNYVVDVTIPDLVCSDGYIHVQVNAS